MKTMSKFIKLISTHDTPLLVRRDAVLLIEGYTIIDKDNLYPDHVGARLTLQAGQWTETIVCIETADQVIALIENDPDQ